MKRSQFTGSFMLVEGDTDARLYKQLVDPLACKVINAQNRDNAISALRILELDGSRDTLAVVDANFAFLEGTASASGSLLTTDGHDLEIMILQSPALDHVLDELGSEEKILRITRRLGIDVRTLLLAASLPLGYLRWLSVRESLSLKFEGLSLNRFIKRQSLAVDVSGMIDVVKNHSQRPELQTDLLLSKLEVLKKLSEDHLHVCCGHDVVQVLAIGLSRLLGSHDANEVRPSDLERSLRLAYRPEYFSRTALCQRIRQWEELHSPYRVLGLGR